MKPLFFITILCLILSCQTKETADLSTKMEQINKDSTWLKLNKPLFDLEKYNTKFYFNNLAFFEINQDSIESWIQFLEPLSSVVYYEALQKFTVDWYPTVEERRQRFPKQIQSYVPKNQFYFLSKQPIFLSQNAIWENFIFLNVQNKKSFRIYSAIYFKEMEKGKEDYGFSKGALGDLFTLASYEETDTLVTTVWTKQLSNSIIQMSKVQENLIENTKDSMVHILKLSAFDGSLVIDATKFRNDVLEYDYSDEEGLRKELGY